MVIIQELILYGLDKKNKMSFEYKGVEIDTRLFEKAIKDKKTKIESHAKYPVQGKIENELKEDYRVMLKIVSNNLITKLLRK